METEGRKQVKWTTIMNQSRVQTAHPTTAARAFDRENIGVKLRRSREKPGRTKEHEEERVLLCDKMRKWPVERFTHGIDMIVDCKMWDAPTTSEARAHLDKQKVVAQLRTRGEGLQKEFTKPSKTSKHRKSGGKVHVLAGISNGRIVLWEYFRRWNGQTAAEMYSGPILKTLNKKRGSSSIYFFY